MASYSTLYPLFLWLNQYRLANTLLKNVSFAYARANDGIFLFYGDTVGEKKRCALDIVERTRRETTVELFNIEACQLFALVEATAKIGGEIAEVGTYNGGSAKIMCEAKGDRPLHLFDTFEGLPEVERVDGTEFAVGQYAASLEAVQEYLTGYPNVFFYKGIFPHTARPIEGKTFSLVHLDVDTYKSTLQCLEFFYPRVSGGGVILSHDYVSAPGVTKAFDEFFEGRPEPVIELSGRQCMVNKLSDG